MGKPKLDKRPARTDLTSRECSKLIGGIVGTLAEMAGAHEIKTAIAWWDRHPEVVDAVCGQMRARMHALAEDMAAAGADAQGKPKN